MESHRKHGLKTPTMCRQHAQKSKIQMINKTQHERTTTIKLKQTNKTRKKAIKLCGMFEKNRWVFSLDLKRSPSIVSYNGGDLCLGEGQAATSSSQGPSHRGKPPRTHSHLQTMVVSAISMCLGPNPRLLCCKAAAAAAALTTVPLCHKLIHLFYS